MRSIIFCFSCFSMYVTSVHMFITLSHHAIFFVCVFPVCLVLALFCFQLVLECIFLYYSSLQELRLFSYSVCTSSCVCFVSLFSVSFCTIPSHFQLVWGSSRHNGNPLAHPPIPRQVLNPLQLSDLVVLHTRTGQRVWLSTVPPAGSGITIPDTEDKPFRYSLALVAFSIVTVHAPLLVKHCLSGLPIIT